MKFEIHHYHHSDDSLRDIAFRDLAKRLGELERKVTSMKEVFEEAVKELRDGTTAVSERLSRLSAEIDGGLSAAEAAPIVAEMKGIAASLKAMGNDPANPNPVPLPPEA